METILPPEFHAGFSPVPLTCKGEINDNVVITISPDNARELNISSVLIKKEQTFNLAAYVQSLFDKTSTQAVGYRVMVNGGANRKCYALRSAAQVGESANMDAHLGGFLTDMKQIDVWQGYPPREVSILAKNGYNAQLIEGDKLQNISLEDGLNTVEVSCGHSKLIVYTNAAAWSDYYCRLEETTYFFTVHVGDRTAKLGGTVSLSIKRIDGTTYTKTARYSGFQDVHFEIPIGDSIIEASITANGELDTNNVQIVAALQPYREVDIPTSTVSLPATHYIFGNIDIGKNSSRLLNITINQPITE